MSNKSVAREVIFFVLVFLMFYLGSKAVWYWAKKTPSRNKDVIILVVAAVFTGAVVGVYYLAKMNQIKDDYQMLNISPGALCRGGPYMWQGDSCRAKMCRKLAASPEGRCEISKFNCPNGYHGLPKVALEYTSDSNSCWEGVHCKGEDVDHKHYQGHPHDVHPHGKGCNCGLCSMWVNGE